MPKREIAMRKALIVFLVLALTTAAGVLFMPVVNALLAAL